ncbi:DUF3558 family protein [Nocardia sp. NPDC056000]|uniref:DUF3558 family protein n=1 Tax=Nocardia sp. NPDC056000 TaxID=3345674 RepID=UPI0035E07A24
MLVLLLMVGMSSCARIAGPPGSIGFSQLPARCSQAWKPAEQEVKAFAGKAQDSLADAADAAREVDDTSQGLTCALKFGSSIQRGPLETDRTPMWRHVSISYFLSLYPDRHTMSPQQLIDYVPGSTRTDSPRPTPIADIGQAAIIWETAGDPRRVSVKFSIDNLIVTVETWGKDWSGVPGTFPVADSPDLRADLRTGTESIAKSLARQIPSTLPTATLTMPSQTHHTSTPTPTKAVVQVWDPCQLPAASLTAAGLDVGSQLHGDNSVDYATCVWSGGWYQLKVSSSDAPFEWSAYEDSAYVDPKPVTIGDRRAVQMHWRDSNLWCVLLFEVPGEANIADKGGRTLTLEASLNEDRPQAALCDELKRVVNATAGALPATT